MTDESNPLHIEAKTLERALVKAGAALGVPQDKVAYRILNKSDGGIASFFTRKKVELHVWHKEGDNISPVDNDQLIEELVDYCRSLCAKITGQEVEVSVRMDGKRLVIDIDDSYLLSSAIRHPKIIESLEHLVRKKPKHLRQGLPFRIFIDVKHHRIDQENELAQMARDLADKVSKNKRPIVMNCKGSHERRVIHLALDGDQRVYTKSIGSGFERKLMILPVKRPPSAQEETGV